MIGESHSKVDQDRDCSSFEYNIQKINKQSKNDDSSRNRCTLQFFQESKEELLKQKEQARNTIEPLSLRDQEVSNNYFPIEIDMPKRPPWDFNMSKEQLELREQKYFTVSEL